MREPWILISLLGLIKLATSNEDFFNKLERSIRETKEMIEEEKLDDIVKMREKVADFVSVPFDEPIFNINGLYFDAAIAEYLEEKNHLSQVENIIRDEFGFEVYRKHFEEAVVEPCKKLNQIWEPTLSAYYETNISDELFTQVSNSNLDNYLMMLNAGFCHNVMRDVKSSVYDSFMYLVCTIKNPGNQCMLNDNY